MILNQKVGKSKHLEGQLEPPVSDIKVYVTKNEHFLKLCPGGRLDFPISDEIVDVKQKPSQLNPDPTIPS